MRLSERFIRRAARNRPVTNGVLAGVCPRCNKGVTVVAYEGAPLFLRHWRKRCSGAKFKGTWASEGEVGKLHYACESCAFECACYLSPTGVWTAESADGVPVT